MSIVRTIRPPSVFFLTGCASGIGLHLAQCLLNRGHTVIATDINLPALQRVAQERQWPSDRSRLVALDVRAWDAWESVFASLAAQGEIPDVVMNIAGVTRAIPLEKITPDDVAFHLDTNVCGVIYGTRMAAAYMKPRRSGHIINIASLAAFLPLPRMSLYTASKCAVRGFSLAAREELTPYGIAVTVVSPDSVKTPMLEQEAENPDAVWSFAGTLLAVEDIERAVFERVLRKKPREVLLPWNTALISRVLVAFPALATPLLGQFEKKGRRVQEQYRRRNERR